MRRLRLSTLLITLNLGLLLLAVAGMAVVAMRLLRQLADEQALARVAQAGASARNAVSQSGENIATSAQLLAERPTLQRLLDSGDSASLSAFLAQFQATSHLDGGAVLLDGRVMAQAGLPVDWEAIWTDRRAASGYFFHSQSGGPLLLGAWSAVPSLPGGTAWTVVWLDEAFAREIGEEVGLPVHILEPAPVPGANSVASLRAQAAAGEPVAARLEGPARYLAVVPLRDPNGQLAGLIETELSAATITQSLGQMVQTLLLLALAVAVVAALASFGMGQRLARPLQRLTRAAARIGHGDLAAPIQAAPSAEIGTLAATLEEMRRQLLRLTADLRRQQAESQAILNGIVEGVFTVDRERRIQYLNPQAAAMLGVTPEAAVGRFCGDVLNPQGPGDVRPCEEQCPIVHARFQAGARATEHLLLSGGRRTVVITSAPPSEHGAVGSAPPNGLRQIQVVSDETEVEATRRLRDAVLANISHEFRTPLSAQLASIELLLDQLPELGVDQAEELVRSLQRGTLRLTQLIDNLLESVRIEAGQTGMRQRLISLESVIGQAVEMMQPLLDQRRQPVRVELPDPLPPILGDAPRLLQVFVNLLANANKFAPPGSAIAIGGSIEAGTVTVWVEDQGPGLPASTGAPVFVPFMRSSAGEPEAGGVGLGLWIVKSIVERHGGRVEVLKSSAAGTRLGVTLPQLVHEDPGR